LDTFKSFTTLLYDVNDKSFDDIALSLFRLQANHNPVYRQYVQNLGVEVGTISDVNDIPFLPISFFKHHVIKTGDWTSEAVFTSSGTTESRLSAHHIRDLSFYLDHAERCFEYFFGALSDYHFLAFLPSYLERSDSSLISMMKHFIAKSQSAYSGFYLHNVDQLIRDIEVLKKDRRKTILWGVSFALLDLADRQTVDVSHCLVFETGGMKGRRREMIREELHAALKRGLRRKSIYSEYGMTELLSQAYMKDDRFKCPPWMKVIAREITDPLQKGILGETGGLNIIDLANWHSIAFIETEDLGKVYRDGTFDVLGRMDNSDVRGCNLMVV